MHGLEFFGGVTMRWLLYNLIVILSCLLFAYLFIDADSGYGYGMIVWPIVISLIGMWVPAYIYTNKESESAKRCRNLVHAEDMGMAQQVSEEEYRLWEEEQQRREYEAQMSEEEEPRKEWREEPRKEWREEPRKEWREEPRKEWREEPRKERREEPRKERREEPQRPQREEPKKDRYIPIDKHIRFRDLPDY